MSTTEGKTFSWQAAVAVGGLLATLIGLWVQYQGKEKELEQAQAKIEQSNREAEERRQAKTRKRAELESRMQQIDSEINAAELEIRRGTSGLAFAPNEQKPLAMEVIQTATAQRKTLLAEKVKLQDTINSLPAE